MPPPTGAPFVDPVEFFAAFFGAASPFGFGASPFADVFDVPGLSRGGSFGAAAPFPSLFGSGGLTSLFSGGLQLGGGLGSMMMSSSSSSSSWRSNGESRTVQTTSSWEGGRRVTRTRTTVQHIDGRVESSEDVQYDDGRGNALPLPPSAEAGRIAAVSARDELGAHEQWRYQPQQQQHQHQQRWQSATLQPQQPPLWHAAPTPQSQWQSATLPPEPQWQAPSPPYRPQWQATPQQGQWQSPHSPSESMRGTQHRPAPSAPPSSRGGGSTGSSRPSW